MRHGFCHRHGPAFGPCGCSLGKLSRLVEPSLLYLLAKGQAKHGYEMVAEANRLGLTDSEIDAAAVYRTLREMERAGLVRSSWQTGPIGPARRSYELTPEGRERLQDWTAVIGRLARHMAEFAAEAESFTAEAGAGNG